MRSFDPNTTRKLARDVLTRGHGSYAFDRGSVGRISVDREPSPQGSASQHRIGRCHRFGVGRVDRRRQPVEKRSLGTEDGRGTSQNRRNVAFGDLAGQGEQLVTDPVTAERRAVVGLVVERLHAQLGTQFVGLGTAERQDRSSMTRGHGGKPICSRTPDQVEQHRFRLIVGGVPGHHAPWKHPVTRGASTRLEIRTRLDGQRVQLEGDTEPARELRRRQCVGVCLRTDSVVDVMSRHDAVCGVGEYDQSD